MKIYTRKGDNCQTTLVGGVPIEKDDIRLEVYGTIDELICNVGFLHDLIDDNNVKNMLIKIQSQLMIAAANFAYDGSKDISLPSLKEENVKWIELNIDEMEKSLTPLNSFILPCGSLSISQAHICRTVCRRAERIIVSLYKKYKFDPIYLKYFNRLSDLFFILARYFAKKNNINEIIWKIGESKT